MSEATTGSVHIDEREARRVAEAARESRWDKPSFAKELYLGRFRLDLIHPHPQIGDDELAHTAAFLDQLRSVCVDEIDGAVIEREARVPDEYVKALARIGVFGIKIPRKYGGLGLSQVGYNRALMLLGDAHPSLGALVSAHQSIGVPEPVKQFGTEEQKQAFLPRCARGAISAFLLTEPDVGSDPARLASTATPVDDGEAYELDGVKLWTTNGVVAELLVVMARVPEHAHGRGGITAFVVEADSPGITVERRNAFMGLRGIENGLTRLTRVRIPAANRIGREGDGLKIALTTLNTGRLSIPALCTAASKWSLKIAREWSVARVQWGKPVGGHAAVAHKIAFMAPRRSPRRPCSTCPHISPTRAAATSASRPRWPSSGRARCPGWSPTSWSRSEADAATRRPSHCEPGASAPCPPSRSCATCGSTGSSRDPPRSCTSSSRARPSTPTSRPPAT